MCVCVYCHQDVYKLYIYNINIYVCVCVGVCIVIQTVCSYISQLISKTPQVGIETRGVKGGACGVIVIVVQNLNETDCISHSTNTLGKGMNPIIPPPAMGK